MGQRVRYSKNVLLICWLATVLAGCGILDMRRDHDVAESIGRIAGTVDLQEEGQGLVYVVLFRPGAVAGEFITISSVIADPDGAYRFSAGPGNYCIGAYRDLNGNQQFDRDMEPAEYFRADGLVPRQFTVAAGATVKLDPLVIRGPIAIPPEERSVDGSLAVTRNIGRVVSLDDPMFSTDNVAMGMWRPVEFLKNVGGGLMMLQPYRPGLTPVIFVHGINGNPADWGPAAATLDPTRFQPWILYYPSGLRLDVVSDYLDRAVDQLQAQHGFESIYVVAHSMGGLVARSFVLKHHERGHAAPVTFFMTINSPMLGMTSAAKGIEISPLVVPSWRDVASGSEFVRGLHSRRLPAGLRYELLFSFQPGENGDGVVPLESQIPLHLQDEAAGIVGFQVSHAGLLREEEFTRRFAALISAAPAGTAAR